MSVERRDFLAIAGATTTQAAFPANAFSEGKKMHGLIGKMTTANRGLQLNRSKKL